MFVSFERAVEIGKARPEIYTHDAVVYGQWADLMLVLAVCDHAAELGWEDTTRCVVAFGGPDPELVEVSIEAGECLWLAVGQDRVFLDPGASSVSSPLHQLLRGARWQLGDEAVEIARGGS